MIDNQMVTPTKNLVALSNNVTRTQGNLHKSKNISIMQQISYKQIWVKINLKEEINYGKQVKDF